MMLSHRSFSSQLLLGFIPIAAAFPVLSILISGAPRGVVLGSKLPLLELKKQLNFIDIMQFVTLCHIYFSLNNHISCC